MTGGSSRRLDIDRAKGLGIVLVVFGHLAAKSKPAGNDWFGYAQTAVYQFHMPFFMYLSGYVGMLTGSVELALSRWPRFVVNRARRLLVPFLAFAFVLTIGKTVATRFMYVDHVPESIGDALTGLFWNTDRSPAISVWYIGVLFVFSAVTPVLYAAAGRRLSVLVLVAITIYCIPLPPILFADKIGAFYIFFVTGAIAAAAAGRWMALVDETTFVTIPLFCVLVALSVIFFDVIPQPIRLLASGMAAIPALHGLVRRRPLAQSEHLLSLGLFSFVIYLLNTLFIGLAKGLLLKRLSWDGSNFLLFLPALMAAGVYGPIITKNLIFRRVKTLDRLTD